MLQLWELGGIFLCGISVGVFCNCSWTDALSIQMHSLYSFLQLKRSGRTSRYLNISYAVDVSHHCIDDCSREISFFSMPSARDLSTKLVQLK